MTSPASAVKATKNGASCVPVVPEPVPAGTCTTGQPDETYRGSSGYCKIPGDICEGGIAKDAPVEKQCMVAQHADFKDSPTILVRVAARTIWQSANEGYTGLSVFLRSGFSAFTITSTPATARTSSTEHTLLLHHGRRTELVPAGGIQPAEHVPHAGSALQSDVGLLDLAYSRDNGRRWTTIDECVQHCAWARDARLAADPNKIWCESFRDKKGSQRMFGGENPLELVVGSNYYMKMCRMFEHVASFVKFSEYLVVAAMGPKSRSLQLQVSLAGANFAKGRFPPSLHSEMLVSSRS
ncbi:uncharacterized protein SCHCODRAFT_01171214 [Schizophyllum commune H4-8]|uniref:uncharacterized protein n=1 Tax=Schizophyllum commune (strain H4-8 / FGSC 9210) TaxID=578458 RepID=UPI00215E94B1|nr:uncharacterized protein SCHCODRAFT_01171214 [Schizophyllum commune H4-8]KAI5891897.1 hypothetical protein SCHCODRAFT_01171214 [Schizophyllum commune H4-8]